MGLLQDVLLHTLTSNLSRLKGALRPSLRRFFINLDNFEIPPSPPVFIFGLPFKLTGNIQFLSVRLPWRRLSTLPVIFHAKGVKLKLDECSLTDSDQQKAVFEAFRRDIRELKEYALANVQYTQTYLSRILQKLLPFLLDRIQIDLSDVTLEFNFHNQTSSSDISEQDLSMVCYLEKLETTSTHSPSRPVDLAKKFTLTGFRIQTFKSNSRGEEHTSTNEIISVQANSCEVCLSLTSGQYHVQLNVPDDVCLHINRSLKQFVSEIQYRMNFWQTAYRYKRPTETIADNPKAWFQYASRAKLARCRNSDPLLTEYGARNYMRSFIEYKNLYLGKLRDPAAFGNEAENQLLTLEDNFDLEMIVMLRDHAQKDALAARISDIDSMSWIGRAFFSLPHSNERQVLVDEIRQALNVVDLSQFHAQSDTSTMSSNDSSNLPKEWSNLQTQIFIHSITLNIADEKGFTRSEVHKLTGNGELYSSLESYGFHLSIGDIFTHSDTSLYFTRGCISTTVDGASSEQGSPFLDITVQKTSLSDFASVDLVLHHASHLVLTKTSVERLFWFSNCIKSFQQIQGGDLSVDHLAFQNGEKVESNFAFQITMSVPSIECWISVGRNMEHPDYEERGILISISEVRVFIGTESGHDSIDVQLTAAIYSGSAMLKRCNPSNYISDDALRKINVKRDRVIEALVKVNFSQEKSCKALRFISGYLSVNISKLEEFVKSLMLLFFQMKACFPMNNQEEFCTVEFDESTGQSALPEGFIIEITSLRIALVETKEEVVEAAAQDIACLTMKGFKSFLHSYQSCTVSVADICLIEEKHGGNLHLAPLRDTQSCIELCYTSPSMTSHQSECIDLSVGIISGVIKPRSIYEITKAFQTCILSAERGQSAARQGPGFSGVKDEDHTSSNDNRIRLSLGVKSLRFEFLSEDTHFLVLCKNSFLFHNITTLTGSLTEVELTNLKSRSERQSWIIKCLPLSNSLISDNKRLSFSISPTSSNITITALHIILTKKILNQITSSIESVSSAIFAAQESVLHTSPGTTNTRSTENTDSSPHTLTIQGTTLFLRLPLSALEPDAVSIEIPRVTAILSNNSTIISLRKLSVLTRTCMRHRDASISRLPCLSEVSIPDWAVVLQGLDLDISHRHSKVSPDSYQNNLAKDDWNVSILSSLTLSATAGQLFLVNTVVSNLLAQSKSPQQALSNFSSETSTFSSDTELAELSRTEQTPLFSSNHFRLKCDTNGITINAFIEDPNGEVNSSLATIELNTISFSLQSLQENHGNGCTTAVTSWHAICDSVQIKDTSLNPSSPRYVFCEVNKFSHGTQYAYDDSGNNIEHFGVQVDAIIRQDVDTEPKSQYNVKVEPLCLRVSGALIFGVYEFFNKAFIQGNQGGVEGSTASSGRSDKDDVMATVEDDHSTEAATKVSVVLTNTTARLYPHTDFPKMLYVDVYFSRLKVVLISSKDGTQLHGSMVKATGISIMYSRLSSLDSLRVPKQSMQQRSSLPSSNDNSLTATPSQAAFKSPQNRHQSSSGGLKFFESSVEQQLEEYQIRSNASTVVVDIHNINIRLPCADRADLLIRMSKIYSDVPVEEVLTFFSILALSEVFSELQPDSKPESRNTSNTFPRIFLTLDEICISIHTPTTAALLTENESLRNKAVIRIEASANLRLDGDLGGIDGNVQLSIEARDEQKCIRDKLVAPTILRIITRWGEQGSFELRSNRYIRVTVSPLTTRLIQGLRLSIQAFVTNASDRNHTSTVANIYNPPYEASFNPARSQILIGLSGLIICCISEDTRAQLLRLTFREINARLDTRFVLGVEQKFELLIRDVILEDVISRYTFREGDEEVEKWSTILSGIHVRNESKYVKLTNNVTNLPLVNRVFEYVGYPSRNLAPFQSESNLYSEQHIEPHPVVHVTARWNHPSDNIASTVKVIGFNVNLDTAIIPSMIDWAESIHREADAVQRAHKTATAASSIREQVRTTVKPQTRICVDHINIEAITLKLAIRAPPRHLQDSHVNRFLSSILGAESVTDAEITLQPVVFNGNFESMPHLLDRLRSLYINILVSRGLLVQLLNQTARLTQFVRVMGMTLLRQRDFGPHITRRGYWRVDHAGLEEKNTAGLRSLFSVHSVERALLFRRNLKAVSTSNDGSETQGSDTDVLLGGVETVDLTFDDRHTQGKGNSEDGKEIFRRLRLQDYRIPRNDTFEYYSAFSFSVSLLVTSKFLLFLNRRSSSIQEPIIERGNVIECRLMGQRISIVWRQIIEESTVKSLARLAARDTSIMATYRDRSLFSSRVMTHEIECFSPQDASTLHEQLMNTGKPSLGLGILSILRG